jgi:peroxiredoxin
MTVAEVIAAAEKNEPPAASVQVLIDQMQSRELSGAACAQITTRAVPIIDGLHSRVERLSAAESLLYTLLDLSAPAESRQSAAAALARAAAESGGKEREVATEYADRGEAGLTYVPADALSAIAFNVPDMTAPSPLSTGLRLHYALKSLANLINQSIDFELSGLDGKTYRLSDYKGRVILLNFWATWCPPCRVEMPTLERLHRDLSTKNLVLFAVSDEDSTTVSDFAKKQGYTLPFLLDPGDRVRDRYGRRGIPQTIIISREGKIIEQFYGVREESEYLATLRRAGLD